MSIILAGNIDSPYSHHYVDAATFSIMLLNITTLSVGLGLASALDTLCSQAYGAKRYEKIGVYFQTGVMVLTVCLVPMLLINSFTESILVGLGQDAEVSRFAGQFSRWMLPGVPCLFLYELTRKVLQAQNIMTPLVTIAVVGNVVNIASAYGLAYHTSIGFNGIAIGRSLGNFVLPLLLVPYFTWRPHHLRQWWCSPWDFKAATRYVGLFLRLGVPGMLMLGMEMWAFEALSILAGLLPDSVVAVAAHSVMVNVSVLIYTAYAGMSVAANIRVGNCLGAGMPKTAKLARSAALFITLILSLLFAVLLFGLSDQIPRLFLDEGKSADLASEVMAIWSPLTVMDGLNAVIQGIFRGTGKQKTAAIANAVSYYVFGVPLGALLAFQCDLGVEGLWLGISFGNVMAVSAMVMVMLYYWNWERLADEARTRTDL
ncbi:Multidrug/Oligosaccharidyl-lipid/polysaccharide (MOP) Flippase Superfamily [Phytophthora palmivora]|uniref:Multidrug/Oligosaccharidyl-lipid/polysaccharide (MOP) Flippase Superfamily n=1 Tax=Phytophthora palmivora TaxID=4796 RepID=A0A2P4XVJ7_9STRA|nr:Multidrug/Oligosaccharidyl-lipid/polysaccharide (MOP) Flippase Superfamily [Phytophthora palmivora]